MKIFMSWSGELSRKMGKALYDWIPSVLQYTKPYFTPEDIKKGERWGNEISRELTDSEFGIFCVTNDNLNSPWMLFEAGAISKNLDTARVCPILFNVKPTDLTGPLQQFQAAIFSRDDIRHLLYSINELANEQKLADSVLSNVFDKWWPDLQSTINETFSTDKSKTKKIVRSDRELLEEILTLVRFSARDPYEILSTTASASDIVKNCMPDELFIKTFFDKKYSNNFLKSVLRDNNKLDNQLIADLIEQYFERNKSTPNKSTPDKSTPDKSK